MLCAPVTYDAAKRHRFGLSKSCAQLADRYWKLGTALFRAVISVTRARPRVGLPGISNAPQAARYVPNPASNNSLLVVGAVAKHSYTYATEVPEGYNRVAFYELQQLDPLPDIPTPRAAEIDGQAIFVKGYIHPSSGSGLLRRFILVPDLGTCCFGGQPRSTDMIEVILTNGQTVRADLARRKLAGKFALNPYVPKDADFDNKIFYQMRADQIR